MTSPGHILIVCTGNVCRSPFIERLLRARLAESAAGATMTVSSAGTGALVGQPMDERAAAQLVEAGGTPDGFVARQLTPGLVASAQLVLTATRRHRGEVATMYPRAIRYTFTFRDFANLASGLDLTDLPQATTGAERMHEVVAHVTARRGIDPPLTPDEADIVDPFQRADKVFVRMSRQVIDHLDAVVKALAA